MSTISGPAIDELKLKLESPNTRYHIDADSKGQVECVTWTTTEQLFLLNSFPEVIMMDETYKVSWLFVYLYVVCLFLYLYINADIVFTKTNMKFVLYRIIQLQTS